MTNEALELLATILGSFQEFSKTAPDGRMISIIPLTYGRARITIGDKFSVDDGW